MKHDFIEIGARIRKLRKENKMTQEQLAVKIDEIYPKSHNRQFLGEIERGEADSIALQYLDAISQIFNCDIGYLLGEIDESRYDIHEISNKLQLSEKAINNILNISDNDLKRIFNTLLENNNVYSKIITNINDCCHRKYYELSEKEINNVIGILDGWLCDIDNGDIQLNNNELYDAIESLMYFHDFRIADNINDLIYKLSVDSTNIYNEIIKTLEQYYKHNADILNSLQEPKL